jgi:hypothetical protein
MSNREVGPRVQKWQTMPMSNWSPRAFWTTITVTFLAVAGLIVYLLELGLDKSAALSGILIAVISILLLGATVLLVIKREGKPRDGQAEAAPALNTPANMPESVKQHAEGHGRNYLAGGSITINQDDENE